MKCTFHRAVIFASVTSFPECYANDI